MPESKATQAEDAAGKPPDRIRFHYIKSPGFRTIHVDGGIGGPTPSGDFHLALYTERFPIPTMTEHRLNPAGGPGEEIADARIVRDGVVREMLVDAVFDLRAAINLRDWFDRNIKILEQLLAKADARSAAAATSEHPGDAK